MLIGPHITNANVATYFAKGQCGKMLPKQASIANGPPPEL